VNYFFKFFVFNTSGSNLHLYVGAKSPTNNYVRSTTSLTVGEWYHVAATSDGSQWRLYINGVEETLVVFSGSNAGRWFSSVDVGVNSYMLGSLQSALTVKETFNGVLDEVRVYNRPLSAAEIFELSGITPPTPTPTLEPTATHTPGDSPTPSPTPDATGNLAHWKLNEGAGQTASDSSGNGRHGTVAGAHWVPGYEGAALGFDGSGDYVDVGNDLFDQYTVGTITAFIKADALTGQTIFASGSDSDANYFFKFFVFNISGGLHLFAGTKAPTNNWVRSTSTLNLNQWYHVAVTSDGNQWRLYINGVEETLVNYSGNNVGNWFSAVDNGTNSYLIGSLQSALTIKETFTGDIDDVRIYGRALSGQEILDLYHATPPPVDVIPPAEITTLVLYNPTFDSISMLWDAPGDDGVLGKAASYQARRSTSAPGVNPENWWNAAVPMTGLPVPKYAGDDENYIATGLSSGTVYYIAVRALDDAGNLSPLNSSSIKSLATFGTSPTINVWYGDNQTFGNNGIGQVWVNIQGNVSDVAGVSSLTYALNGGPSVPLSIGPDNRRLDRPGDFNVDIDISAVNVGANTVVISATNSLGNTSERTVNFTYNNISQDLPFTLDWSTVNDFQEVAQSVDGRWVVENDHVRETTFAYDRMLVIGDMSWVNYEVTVPVTVHAVDPQKRYGSHSGLGLVLRWGGHTDNPVSGWQPKSGWNPNGGIGWWRWDLADQTAHLEFFETSITHPMSPTLGVTYLFKMRIQSITANAALIRLKVWEQGTTEPTDWMLEYQKNNARESGSIVLLPHYVDASFGTVEVTPLDSVAPPTATPTNTSVPTPSPTPPNPSEDDLVAYWKFNEGSGGITADHTGNGHTGIVNSAHWSPGYDGSALGFDQVTEYVDVGDDLFDTHHQGTIAAWIRVSELGGQTIFSSGSDTDANQFFKFHVFNSPGNNPQLWISTRNPGNNAIRSISSLNLNTWYHVAATSDGTIWRLYINGVEEQVTVFTGSNQGLWFSAVNMGVNSYSIGSLQNALVLKEGFRGDIDEVQIYNRPLSPAEIQQLHGSLPAPPADTTPPAHLNNFEFVNTTETSTGLRWNAPGDDGNAGKAVSYDIRYSTTSPGANAETWWSAAQSVPGIPVPRYAGHVENLTVQNLTEDTLYFFAIRAYDDAGNSSPFSLSSIRSLRTRGGLIGHWQFSENSGNLALDSSGNGKRGILFDAHWVPGYAGSGIGMETHNEYVGLDNDIYDSYSAGTIAGWINLSDPSGQTIFCSGSNVNANYYFRFYVSATSGLHYLRAGTRNPDNNWVRSTSTLNVNTWYHVAVTSDGSRWRLYINGVEDAAVPFSGGNTGGWFSSVDNGANAYSIGTTRITSKNSLGFKGSIDDLQVYNRALSAAEIEQIYDGYTPPPADTTPPEEVKSLSFSNTTTNSTRLHWKSPGDDGNYGVSVSYQIRYSTTAPGSDAEAWWNAAVTVNGVPIPKFAGHNELFNVNNLTSDTLYYFAVRGIDEANNISPISTSSIKSVVIFGTQPYIDVWYSDNQTFANNGTPQQWVNILGNVSDLNGVTSLSYSLNGGPFIPLTIGPDNRRLNRKGDFNADIPVSSLTLGANSVVLRAMNTNGNMAERTVNFTYNNTSRALPFTLDWSGVTNIQEVAQPVDGKWVLSSGKARLAMDGYDRFLAIGDMSWTDYEVTVPITIHAVDQDKRFGSNSGLGLLVKWQGHSDDPVSGKQPKAGWNPYGIIGWWKWDTSDQNANLEFFETSVSTPMTPTPGKTYLFKMRVETVNANTSLFSLKAWEQGTTEPAGWFIQYQKSNALASGSLCLLAHYVDASFGTVQVNPLSGEIPTSTPSPTPSNTATPTSTHTPGPTSTPTSTHTPGPSSTPTSTHTPGPTSTPTSTHTPGPSSTPAPTDTPEPSSTPTPIVTPSPTVPVPSDLLGFWTMEEGSGTVTTDLSGSGNHGTLINGPLWTSGKNGNGIYFDGFNDHVNVGTFDVSGNQLTLAAWINVESFNHLSAQDGRIISKANGVADSSHWWMLSSISASGGPRLRFRLKTNGSTSTLIASTGTLETGKWTHVAAVYNGSTMTLYKDGVQVGQMAKSGNISMDSSVPVWIGSNPPIAASRPFRGTMDDVRVYSRALSPGEIASLAGGGSGENTPTNTPLPTDSPPPTNTPLPTDTPLPTNTPSPTDTLLPTSTHTPGPSSTPTPTDTPGPTSTPTPTDTPEPTSTPTPIVTPSPTVPVPSDLLGFWTMEEGSGTVTTDLSGSGNHGTLINGPLWTSGKNGNGIYFDGFNDHVNVGTFDVSGNQLTLAAWINVESFNHLSAQDGRIISKANGLYDSNHFWMLSSISASGGPRLRFRLKTNGSTSTLIASTGTLETGKWTHVAAVYNGSTMTLYKDGVQVGQMAKSGNISMDSSVPVWIGSNPPNGDSRPFRGTIDDVQVYSRALSQEEIQSLQAAAPGPLIRLIDFIKDILD
jgi:hypothetical protein